MGPNEVLLLKQCHDVRTKPFEVGILLPALPLLPASQLISREKQQHRQPNGSKALGLPTSPLLVPTNQSGAVCPIALKFLTALKEDMAGVLMGQSPLKGHCEAPRGTRCNTTTDVNTATVCI